MHVNLKVQVERWEVLSQKTVSQKMQLENTALQPTNPADKANIQLEPDVFQNRQILVIHREVGVVMRALKITQSYNSRRIRNTHSWNREFGIKVNGLVVIHQKRPNHHIR